MKDTQLLTEEEMETYKNAYRGFLTTEKELAEVYQSSKINVNITLQGKSSLNYRVFEIPASCGFLITDYMDDLEENFEISRDLEAYRDVGDLVDKIKFYLKNPQIAERIAINGAIKTAKKQVFPRSFLTFRQGIVISPDFMRSAWFFFYFLGFACLPEHRRFGDVF